ncbi:hypothetical protein [Tardiphaga sp. 709]|uniref:hypothetical protein n=1 Tax=Tardiphaga sp. 709 TaxID=3076039 RepID=UPI0028EE61C1|nr:hypothetical protein [Tardiphaga sp. 709]WNV10592.1 hypothetical protein RSO67_05220 [Tardiphaga sp. 709]
MVEKMANFLKYFVVGLYKRILALSLTILLLLVCFDAWVWFTLPSVIRGIPAGIFFPAASEPETKFRDRIRLQFPIGSEQAEMVARLTAQGFGDPVPLAEKQVIAFRDSSFPCLRSWSVIWQASSIDTLENIDGHIHYSCL